MAFKGPRDDANADVITDDVTDTATDAPSLSLLDELRARPVQDDEEYVNPWLPLKEGDGLEGTVVRVGRYVDDTYSEKVYRTYVVQEDNEQLWTVIPFHAKLRRELIAHRPDVGDRIAILFLGEKESRTDPDMTFMDYAVARKAAARIRRTPRSITP